MDTVHFFTDVGGRWRWHRRSENGRIVADSGEGYNDLNDARTQVLKMFGDTVRLVYDEPDHPVMPPTPPQAQA